MRSPGTARRRPSAGALRRSAPMASRFSTVARNGGSKRSHCAMLAPLILLASCLATVARAELNPAGPGGGRAAVSADWPQPDEGESAVPEWTHSLEAALARVGDGRRGGAKGAFLEAPDVAAPGAHGRVMREPEEATSAALGVELDTAQGKPDAALPLQGNQADGGDYSKTSKEQGQWREEGEALEAAEWEDSLGAALARVGDGRQGLGKGEMGGIQETARGGFEGRDLRAIKKRAALRRRKRVQRAADSSQQEVLPRGAGAGAGVSAGMVARDQQALAELKRRQEAKKKKPKRAPKQKTGRRKWKIVRRKRRGNRAGGIAAQPAPSPPVVLKATPGAVKNVKRKLPPKKKPSPSPPPPKKTRSPKAPERSPARPPRRTPRPSPKGDVQSNPPSPDSTPPGAAPDVSITVTAFDSSRQYVIHPGVYGTNDYRAAPLDVLAQAGVRLVRRGGNKDTRYNWEVDATNRAADWYFQSIAERQIGGVSSFDQFVQDCKANGITPMAQIPMLEWLPKSRERLCSFSVKKYGPQNKTAPDNPDCGNGRRRNAKTGKWEPITDNDPTDAAVRTGTSHQNTWVSNIAKQHGSSANGGVRFFALDNEPPWWSYVHRDIHPQPSTYDEILTRGIAYAEAIKSADPTAIVTGPVSGGWSDVFYSITDFQAGWRTGPDYKYWSNPVDRKAHGDVPFMEFYLQGMASYEHRNGVRLLDIVDVHAYITPANDRTDSDSQATRVAATRIFWDPDYVCKPSVCDFLDARLTATDGVPKFLVRLQKMIKHRYPGTGLAVTEYDFGGNQDPSGAVAQAEALGVFGKFNVSAASLHPGLVASSSKFQAFKMYGNYDNRGNSFGSLGVGADSTDTTAVSAYAALTDDKSTLTVMLINLTPSSKAISLRLTDVRPSKPVRVFQYDGVSSANIVQLDSLKPATRYSLTLPGYSLTLLEVAAA